MNIYNLSTVIPLCISAILLIIVFITYSVDLGKRITANMNDAKNSSNTISSTYIPTTNYQRTVAGHICLLIITFGIYNFVWIYRTTKYFNQTQDEEHRGPCEKLLLCIFIPLYYQYWVYQTALRADKLAKDMGVFSNLTTICSLSSFVTPFIPSMLIQDRVNTIEDKKQLLKFSEFIQT